MGNTLHHFICNKERQKGKKNSEKITTEKSKTEKRKY
uniref:Uncharacterized protein n=1 Tax=Rhizophora mucronata TaxID=61149 RepID=A0A2P2LLJ6_RHIMU